MFDDAGEPLTPSHAVKSSRRYHYYISRHLIRGDAEDGKQGWRLPAREIERVVMDVAMALFNDPAKLTTAARQSGIAADHITGLLDAIKRWQGKVFDLVTRFDLHAEHIVITLDLSALTDKASALIRHQVPIRIQRRGVEMRLVLQDHPIAKPDTVLIKAVARAHQWFDDLLTGRV